MELATTADQTAIQAFNLLKELRTDLALLNYQAHIEMEMQKKMNAILRNKVETLEAEIGALRKEKEFYETREKSHKEVITHVEEELEKIEIKLKKKQQNKEQPEALSLENEDLIHLD